MTRPTALSTAAALLFLGLAGCGGGGGDSGGAAAGGGGGGGGGGAVAVPGSGTYAIALTAQGSSAAPTYGLSFIHPGATTAEFVIEAPSVGVSDIAVVASGSVDSSQAKVSAIQPVSAVYIAAGDVRRVSLVANGVAPATQVQKSGTTGACRFLVQGNDYATPDQSRYIVSTVGADGVCGTADDGQAEVILNATGGLAVTAVSGAPRLGLIRDVVTLAPRGWYTTTALSFWSPPATLAPQSQIDAVVLTTHKSAVVERIGGGLALYNLFNVGGSPGFSETALDAALTAGTGWRSVGYDAASYYVYRNSGTSSASSTWSVLKIDRQNAAVTPLASGTGLLATTAMGVSVLFATETGPVTNRLLTIAKATPGTPTVLESSSTTIATVTASAVGAHQLWRRDVAGGGNSTVEFINESGVKIFSSTSGGYPFAPPDPTTIGFNSSENHTLFLFANGYGAAGFSGATLQTFDASAATSVVIGALPGAARFGSDPVSVGVTPAPQSFLAGYAARAPGGTLGTADVATFSFDVRTAGSLHLTTTKQ